MTHRVFKMSFASVYPHYLAKAEKKGRTKAEVDEIIRWLTGYTDAQLAALLKDGTNFEDFYGKAPALNPNRVAIRGMICGYRVEEIADPLMRELRYLDKLIDELAKGKAMEKILRAAEPSLFPGVGRGPVSATPAQCRRPRLGFLALRASGPRPSPGNN
jgi:hypothetical protein